MKKLYFLDEEEKNRVLNLHESATKKQYLMETPLTDFNDKLPDETSKKFTAMNNTWQGGGTREGDMLKVLKTFTANDYKLYNQYLLLHKNSSDPFEYSSFQEIINGEMGKDNLDDVKNIVDALKKLKVTATFESPQGDPFSFKENSFKITSKPVVVVANTNNGLTDAAIACIKQYGEPKPAKTPGFVFVNTEDDESVFFSKDYEVRYRLTDGKIIYGQWACKSNIFTIMTDDDETWSKAQGGWKGTQPKTAVVDPKKAYQERAKQVNQQTTDTTKQIQQALGQDPTGNLDALYIDNVIDLLKQ
jgi:hypothetical protein